MKKRVFSRYLILGLSLGLIALFQNMSWVDIRDLAPARPEGYTHDPLTAYIPTDLRPHSLEDIGQGFLSHNFDPWFHQFEVKYLRMETPFFGMSFLQSEDVKNGEIASLGNQSSSSRSDFGKWRVAVVNPQKMRVTLLKRWSGHEYEMTWEAQSGEEGVRWALSRPLTEQISLGLVHQSGLRQSQIQMDYSF